MPEIRRLLLDASGSRPVEFNGGSTAIYVMVTTHGRTAKVGLLERAANAAARLKAVDKAHRVHDPDGSPTRLAVIAEIDGMVLLDDHDEASEELWAEVEHIESAIRLVLARRFGRVATWIHVDRVLSDDEWVAAVQGAWDEVRKLGRVG